MKKLFFFVLILSISFSYAQVGFNFDGVDDYVETSSAGPAGTSDRTVECWFKTSNVISTQQILVDWGSISPLGSRFTLNYIANGRLRIEIGGNGFNSNQTITDGNWHHVAVTYDHLAATKACLIVDGVTDTCRNFTRAVNTTSSGPITIGRRLDQANKFQGSIDEVRIWNTARSEAVISRFMSSEFCNAPNDLVAYYKFEDGLANGSNSANTIVTDYAGSNNGTIYNATLNGSSSNWTNGVSLNTFQIPKTITQSNDTIYFNSSNISSYTWLDCNNNSLFLSDTLNYFIPASSGNYAVLFSAGTCVDTSDCYAYVATSIPKQQVFESYSLKSNLVKNDLQINIKSKSNLTFQLFDMQGRMVKQYHGLESGNHSIYIPNQSGLYFLSVTDGQNKKIHKIIKVN